jgi:hypothetical protein
MPHSGGLSHYRPTTSAAFVVFPPPDLGDQQMRILIIIALSATLAGCTGDRVKQAQSPDTTPVHFSVV